MGRKPKPITERTNNLIAFRYPLFDPQYSEALQKIYFVMEREKKDLGEIISEALLDWSIRHYDHAFQHQLTQFTHDSATTKVQIETNVLTKYLKYPDKLKTVYLDDIKSDLEKHYTDPKKRAQATIRISKELALEGVEVHR